ncbi:putative chromatin associated protein KTI12 [Monocercomonoides exilis]|uniref:putative chromatin associated protein KTI12 n=1 Tax=Monocercomonoides exilis TaxID=2049356 RepID=UPI00355944FF|nr:putative chromatin associated protein KTI12 [Monocercomonoides exilis]
MPLILICGPPASGKTSVATALSEYLNAKQYKVTVVNEETLGLDKTESYKDNYGEMNLRSSLKTAVYQALSTPGTASQAATPSSASFGSDAPSEKPNAQTSPICICDSLNYIRGFRYELFCIARQFLTTFCLVYCTVPMVEAYKWNDSEEREQSKYSPEMFIDLTSRFEVPSEDNHWERPFFKVQPAPQDVYDEYQLLGSTNRRYQKSRNIKITHANKCKECEDESCRDLAKSENEKQNYENQEGDKLHFRGKSGKEGSIEEEEEEEEDEDDEDDSDDTGEDEEWKQSLKQIEKLEKDRKEYLEKMKCLSFALGEEMSEADPLEEALALNDLSSSEEKEKEKAERLRKDEEERRKGWKLFANASVEEIDERLVQAIPFDLIEKTLFATIGLTPPKSTLKQTHSDSSTVYEFGVVTQNVVDFLVEAQRVCLPGDSVAVPGCSERFVLPRTYSLHDLRQLRRRFLNICHQISISGTKQQLGDFFLQFLSKQGEMV